MPMTPLLQQFIAEGRDLLEKSGAGILQLEKDPADARTIHEVFRALHTLKGSSGLFDPEFAPLTRVAHAGEDLLSEARNGRLPFTRAMADALLATLDLLTHWLDAVEQHQQLPGDAANQGDALATTLRGLAGQAPPVTGQQAEEKPSAATMAPWLAELPAFLLQGLRKAGLDPRMPVTVLRYEPDAGCFFMGEDPLYTVRQTPGLVAMALSSLATSGEEFDPFTCQLRFDLIATAPREEVANLFRYVEQQVQIAHLPPAQLLGDDREDPALLLQVLREQREVLTLFHTQEEWLACFPSMVHMLTHAVRQVYPRQLAGLEAAIGQAESQKGFAPLRAFLATLPLDGEKPRPAAPVVPQQEAPHDHAERSASRTLKVEHSRIDRLMELAGELVVAKNAMPYLAQLADREYQARNLARQIMESYGVLNRLVEEVQASVLQVRMLPVGTVFQRFPRLVRDISRKLNKDVRLVLEGEGTEADKNVIEILSEPLIHLVRNSLDHAMETADERLAAGKTVQGEIRLSARQESDRVVIEVRDDGRGVDPLRVKAKALAKGLIDQTRHDALSDQEAVQLIFEPGFSTAEQVSDLSGRGVGMDAVRAAVGSVGGQVTLESRKGQGSLVRLELPMTMAVTRVMLVEEGHTLYGIPLDQVAETVRIASADIHGLQNQETVILRERVLPLYRLNRLLGLPGHEQHQTVTDLPVLVIKVLGHIFCLAVGGFQKGVDIVLKPLEGIMAGIPGYNGAALLGNGRVLLVLNLKELVGRGAGQKTMSTVLGREGQP